MDTIFILNSHKQVIDVLSNNGSNPSAPFFDDTYKSELDTGAESYEFTTINNPRTNVTLEVGNYVLFKYNDKYKLFQIMETEDEHSEGKKLLTVYAEMAGMELLNDYCEPFSIEGNFITLLERALQDTNWRVGTYSASLLDNIQSVSYSEPKNVYSIIQENLATFGGVEIEFRVEFRNNQLAALLIDCYESGTRGNRKYRRFEYGKDVKGLTRNRNINDLATAVIGQGNNNVTFKDIEWDKNLGNPCDKPLQQDFVVDIEANDLWNNGGKYIKTVHKVDTDDPQTLLQECWDYLQEIKQPKFDYDVDLALVAEDYQDIGIGDTNYVLDFDYQPAILLEARVGTLELSFADPRDNKCVLTNYKELTSILQQPVDLNTVGNMIQSHFPIQGEDIAMGAIGEGHINVTYYQAIKTDIMSATLAEVGTLIADKADITDLTALNAQIENLKVNKAEITDLNAINGNVTNLTSQVGNIETLLAGNATAGNVQSIHLTSANATIDDAVIKNAMIDTVSGNKVNTGTLNTNNVNIESEDGGIKISGATQQFKDKEGHVRVQIGKDAQGNFTFCLFSQDGVGILLDETGIKAGAVPDGLIVNDMVADNANISGNKIDIASVITNINNNTTSIKSSAIKFDDTGQSLLVAFNELKNTVNTIEEVTIDANLSSVIEQVQTNTTQIGVVQGQISSLITNTTLTKENGQVVQLKDDYSATKQTVSEISTKMGSLETNYKKTLKTSSVQYYLSTSLTELTGGSWQDTAPSWTQGKYMWQRMKYTYTDGSTTYGTASCVAGAKGDTGEQGIQGPQGEQGIKGDTGSQGPKGDKGDKGDIGPQGVQGPAGKDGKAYYTWIKYADSSTGSGMSNDPTGKSYIGFAYNKTTSTESNTASDYTWSLIKGEKGDTGVQGPAGSNGKTTYTWIKYSDNADGTGLYDTPKSTTKYIGIATNKTTATESTAKTDYTWSLFKGDTGPQGPQGSKGDTGSQGPKGDKGATGEKGQSLTSSTPQWYLSTSNTTQAGGSWVETIPQVTTGKYIWQRFKNVWANPTATTYTTPVLEEIAESVKEVTSKQAEFKKTLDEVSSTLTETTTTANTALTKATTAQENLDGFKTTVSKIYTTKTDFNNLSIGGRNLAQKTSSDYSPSFSNFSGKENECVAVSKVLTDGLAIGDTITVRLVYKYTDIVPADGQTATCRIQGRGDVTGWKSGMFPASEWLTLSGSGEHIFNYNYTIAENHLLNSYWRVELRHDHIQSGSITWKMFKVEKGNKATDWTPAPEDIDDKFTNYSTTEQMNSAIDQKAGEITSTVSSTYTTKTDFDNLSIGSRNLLPKTDYSKKDSISIYTASNGGTLSRRKYDFGKSLESDKFIKGDWVLQNSLDIASAISGNKEYSRTKWPNITLEPNTEYTLSMWMYKNNNCGRCYFSVYPMLADGSQGNIVCRSSDVTDYTGGFVKVVKTFNTGSSSTTFSVRFYNRYDTSRTTGNSDVRIYHPKLEKGNKATDWSPASEDIETQFNSVTKSISEVKQTAESVTYKFENCSQTNLLPHSGVSSKNTTGWYIQGNAWWYTGHDRYLGIQTGATEETYAWSPTFSLGTNGWYSLHGWINAESNTKGADVFIIGSTDDNMNYDFTYHCCNVGTNSGWQHFSATFEVPSNIRYLRIRVDNNGRVDGNSGNYVVVFFGEFMLVRGKDNYPLYTDSVEGLYAGVTSIDKNGVHVTHDDGSNTNLNAKALNFYDTSNRLYAQVQGGMYKFWNGSQWIGYMGHTAWADTNDQERVIVLASEYGCSTSLSSRTSSNSKYQTWVATFGKDTQVNNTLFHKGCTLTSPHLSGVFKLYGTSAMTDTYPAQIYHATDGQLAMFGDNKVALGVMEGATLRTGILITEDGYNSNKNHIDFYGPVNMNGYSITNAQSVNSLNATSAQTYALRTMSDEESYSDPTVKTITDIFPSQTPTEGEIRWTDRETHFTTEVETGVYECYIEIPWWIAQNLENNYHVTITPTNGFYQYYVSERDPYYFTVRSDKDGMGFTFEIVGKLLDNNTTAHNASIASNQYGASASEAPDIIPEFDIVDTANTTDDIVITDTTSDI